jgi:DNA-binding CsgD family transcriptional regulator
MLGIPESLREVVRKHLSRVSATTNQTLSVAAVIGREFPLAVLQRVHALQDEELANALEESVTAGLIEERPGIDIAAAIAYRFRHAYFQQALYEDMVAPRRVRLHAQIARALDGVYGRRKDEHAAELAEHYAYSSDPADLAKAVHYSQRAAQRARAVFAYSEAVRQLERALQLSELLEEDDLSAQCDLLLELGEALTASGDADRAIRYVAPRALETAARLGDTHRAFRACLLAVETIDTQAGSSSGDTPEYLTWAERADRYAEPNSMERAHANLALAYAHVPRARMREARMLRVQALELARRHGDIETLFKAAVSLMESGAPQYWGERLPLTRELVVAPWTSVNSRLLGLVLWYAGRVELAYGYRARATEIWADIPVLANRAGDARVLSLVPEVESLLAVVDGRLEQALALLRQFVARADELGAGIHAKLSNLYMLLPVAGYLGRAQDWLVALAKLNADWTVLGTQNRWPVAGQALCLANLGRLDEARSIAGPFLEQEARGVGDPERHTLAIGLMLQVAIALQDRDAASALAAKLDPIADLSIAEFCTCPARHLGAAAAFSGDRNAARNYYLRALESAGRIGFRPELALVHVQFSELLTDEGDLVGALQHLDLAIPELRSMQMVPALEHAQSLARVAMSRLSELKPGGEASSSVTLDGLTPREREVADLLALGKSNREIAAMLVISEATAKVHVKRILDKFGLTSRAQVAARATRTHAQRH